MAVKTSNWTKPNTNSDSF
ncbi:hypothetical protein CAEBREN_03017 [Caenorhabditis brenneri]|uniref:Uncharacterized protein n=1 Tax=Caenorhabditis brenneri TaxID=135651 RepID=G0MZL4_CAEBE|nr:hypothetical protein CAEBREN_03017 [Caenorhabditis brenneri]